MTHSGSIVERDSKSLNSISLPQAHKALRGTIQSTKLAVPINVDNDAECAPSMRSTFLGLSFLLFCLTLTLADAAEAIIKEVDEVRILNPCSRQSLSTERSSNNTGASMAIKRSRDFLLAGYALSRLTQSDGSPPAMLITARWNEAYDRFFDTLADGRTPEAFRNSLKNVRDAFDAHMNGSPRTGWRDEQNLEQAFRKDTGVGAILDEWSNRSDEEVKSLLTQLLDSAEPSITSGSVRTEGGKKAYVSYRTERNSSLRQKALEIHGLSCQVCGFNFEERYGTLGAEYVEVHHMAPLAVYGARETDPKLDLSVLCANCHRMIHRNRGVCLTLDELRAHMRADERVATTTSVVRPSNDPSK